MNKIKLNIVFVAAICWFNIGLHAQTIQNTGVIKLKNAANLPYPLTWTTSVSDGRYIYALAGYNDFGGYSSAVVRYDPQRNSWIKFADMGGNKSQLTSAYVPATNKIYIMDGLGGQGTHRQLILGVQSIDLKTGKVENLHVQNPIPAVFGYAVEWQNKIYLFGGTREGGQTTSALYQFDPATAVFKQLADMPESLQTTGVVINGVIYTFGGYDAFTKRQSSSINAYNISTNTWKKVGELPASLSDNCVAACGNLVFIAGGYDQEDFLGYFDTTGNRFTKLKSNIEPRKHPAAAVVNNWLFIFGGDTRYRGFRNTVLKTMQTADITTLLQNRTSR